MGIKSLTKLRRSEVGLLCLYKRINLLHCAALDAGNGVELQHFLRYRFIKRLRKFIHELLCFIKLLGLKKFAETTAHVINVLANSSVTLSAHDALAKGLFGILQVWHRKVLKG